MKTKVIFLFALLAVIVFGCSPNQEMNHQIDDENGYRVEILQAILKGDFPFTKLTQAKDGSDRIWENSDAIAVFAQNPTTNAKSYITGSSIGEGKFKFNIPTGYTRDYFAIYPAGWAVLSHFGEPDLKVDLPEMYEYEAIKNQKAAIGLVAINDPTETSLYFEPICGSLRLTVTGVPAGTGAISVVFDNKCITGSFLVEDPDGEPSIKLSDSASEKGVMIYFDEATTADGSYVVNIPMPVTTTGAKFTAITGSALKLDENWEPESELASGNATFPASASFPTFTGTVQRGKLYEFTLALQSAGPISTVTTTPMDVETINIQDGNHNTTWN